MHSKLAFLDPRLWDDGVIILVRVAGILLLAWLVRSIGGRLIQAFRDRIAEHISDAEHARRAETLARVFRYVANVVISLIAGIWVLGELGISVAPILGAAGVVGLALGFGAQSLVKDYFTGFFLLFENQVTRGDVVELAGKSGAVEDVTLRYVRLRDYEGNLHFIPNGLITTVTNSSRGHAFAAVDLAVSRNEDLARVYALLAEVAEGMRSEGAWQGKITAPLEISGVERLEAAAVVVRCRLRVVPLSQWEVRRELLRRLQGAMRLRGIAPPDTSIIAVVAPPTASATVAGSPQAGRSNTSTSA
jgi:moderate conductance mechanosensitive channel